MTPARSLSDRELIHAVDCDTSATERERELAQRLDDRPEWPTDKLEDLAARVDGAQAALLAAALSDEATLRQLLETTASDLRGVVDGLYTLSEGETE